MGALLICYSDFKRYVSCLVDPHPVIMTIRENRD